MATTTRPTNTDDIIDSRDVIARIDELEQDALLAYHYEYTSEVPDGVDAIIALEETDADELRALRALAAEGVDSAPDWRYGETLIRDSYFREYAMELAEDLYGVALGTARWPFTCIDWEEAAYELRMDYSSVDFDGVTYWVR